MIIFSIFLWILWFYTMIRLIFVNKFLDKVQKDAYNYDIHNYVIYNPEADRITGKYVDFWFDFLKLVCIPKPLKYKYWFTEEEIYFLKYHKIKHK